MINPRDPNASRFPQFLRRELQVKILPFPQAKSSFFGKKEQKSFNAFFLPFPDAQRKNESQQKKGEWSQFKYSNAPVGFLVKNSLWLRGNWCIKAERQHSLQTPRFQEPFRQALSRPFHLLRSEDKFLFTIIKKHKSPPHSLCLPRCPPQQHFSTPRHHCFQLGPSPTQYFIPLLHHAVCAGEQL